MALSMLVFRWSVRRGGGENLHESEVRCDYALERGVPHPETSYCTKAELDHIAMTAASSHEATLRQKVDQDNVVVMCKCAPTKIEWASIFKGVGRTRLLVRGREKQRRRNQSWRLCEEKRAIDICMGRSLRRSGGNMRSVCPLRPRQNPRGTLTAFAVLHRCRLRATRKHRRGEAPSFSAQNEEANRHRRAMQAPHFEVIANHMRIRATDRPPEVPRCPTRSGRGASRERP